MYKAVFFHTEVNEHTESCNVVDFSGKFLADVQVVDLSYRVIKWNFFGCLARIASGLFKLKYYIRKSGQSDLFSDIFVKFDAMKQVSVF